ncbi:hypothetical protein AB7Y13_27200, partial [Escherichia coli]|nr:hypothetical protein [Escherichia coli]
ADRNRSHWSTSKTPSYTKSVSWQHHPCCGLIYAVITKRGSTTLPFGPCLSLGGIATLYLQALF